MAADNSHRWRTRGSRSVSRPCLTTPSHDAAGAPLRLFSMIGFTLELTVEAARPERYILLTGLDETYANP